MAKYTGHWFGITAAAVADTTTFTAGQAPGFLRAGANQFLKINEVQITGEDSASLACSMLLARTSTLSVGALTVGNLTLDDAIATAQSTLPNWGSTAATTFPQRSSSAYLLNCGLNTWGGQFRWQARFGEELTQLGVATPAAPAAETIISSRAGAGKTSGHILFEAV